MIGIITLLILIAVVGVVAWAIIKLVPMPAPFQTVIVVVAILLVLLVLLRSLGGIDLAVPVIR